MSTVPRVSSGIAGQPAHLGSALAHQPELAANFYNLYGTFWSHGVLDHRTKEIARMRNARITDCGFCKMVRFEGARNEGLTEAEVAQIEDGYEDSSFSAKEQAVLKLTDAIIGDPRSLSAETQAELRSYFTPAELTELALGVGLFIGMSKVLVTLGLEPEPGTMPVTVVPTPGSAARQTAAA